MLTFAERLSKALLHGQLSAVQLASRLGVTRQAIENAEKGRSNSLSAENCARAARVLGVNWYWLATGEEEMTSPGQAPAPHPVQELLSRQSLFSPRSQKTLETLLLAAERDVLTDDHWAILDELTRRFIHDRKAPRQ